MASAWAFAARWPSAALNCPRHRELRRLIASQHAKGEYQEAIARLEGLLALRADPFDIAMLGFANARGGRPIEARLKLGELQKPAGRHFVPSYYLALLHAGLGQTAESFQWLERAYEDGDVFMSELTWNPSWDSVRADRRFASLLQRMNLPASAS